MNKRGNGEGTIYYSENLQRWIAQYSVNGKRKSVYGKTKKEANEKKLVALSGILTGKYVDKNNIKFIALMKTIEENKLLANVIKESSYVRNLNTIITIENYFNDIKLQEVNSEQLQLFFNTQINKSQSVIDKLWQTINGAFKQAIREDFLIKNPLDKILKPISRKNKKQIIALTVFEQKQLLSYLKSHNKDFSISTIILLSLFTGMRIGEICALQYNDIDFENQRIIISKTLTKDKSYNVIMGNTTKTGRKKRDGVGKREIPFKVCQDRFLSTILSQQINYSKTILQNKTGLLFCELDGSFLYPAKVNRIFKIICKNAKIKIIDTMKKKKNKNTSNLKSSSVNFHMCRHTFATRFIESGGDAVVLSKLLGHSKIQTTLDVYVDVFDKFRDKRLNELKRYYKDNELIYKIS